MKALTLTQPWATLVAIGAKTIETRAWRTWYRGPLAIHAARNFPALARDLCEREPFATALAAAVGDWRDLPRGAVVATCRLVDCLRLTTPETLASYEAHTSPSATVRAYWMAPPDDPELSFGDYSPGRFAWLLEDLVPLVEAVPARGALGLWTWCPREPARQPIRREEP